MLVRGWLETKNTYAFDTKVCFNIYQNIQLIFY